MAGRLVLDTNAVIAYRTGVDAVCKHIDATEILYVPIIVVGELLFGALSSSRREKNEKAVRVLMVNSVVVPIDEEVAEQYAHIRISLKQSGHPIPENDIWIAATCKKLSTPLLSNDGHFSIVIGLEVIRW